MKGYDVSIKYYVAVRMFDLAITLTSKDCVTQIYVPSINAGWLPAFAYFYEIHCNMHNVWQS